MLKTRFVASKIDNPTQGEKQSFFLTPEKCPDLNGKVVEIYENGKFHGRGVVKTRKSAFLTLEVWTKPI